MFNSIVCYVLEVIFGIWLICAFLDFFFNIDIPEILRKLISNHINKRGER